MERVATITTIGDDFNTLNLAIDPPVLTLNWSDGVTEVLSNPTMENGSLAYSVGPYLYYVRYENGVPSYVEYGPNSGGSPFQ